MAILGQSFDLDKITPGFRKSFRPQMRVEFARPWTPWVRVFLFCACVNRSQPWIYQNVKYFWFFICLSKIILLVKQSYFWSKIILFWSKIIFFSQKSYFLSKIIFLVKESYFWSNDHIFGHKSYYWSKIIFLVKNDIFCRKSYF